MNTQKRKGSSCWTAAFAVRHLLALCWHFRSSLGDHDDAAVLDLRLARPGSSEGIAHLGRAEQQGVCDHRQRLRSYRGVEPLPCLWFHAVLRIDRCPGILRDLAGWRI